MFEMKVQQFTKEFKSACLAVFDSNLPLYFADEEREEFSHFLDAQALVEPYFVMTSNSNLLACGGYLVVNKVAELRWGMVNQSSHKTGRGKALLKYRLEQIFHMERSTEVRIMTSQHTEGFFNKFGFVTTDKINNGFKEGLHQVKMRLNQNDYLAKFLT